MKFLNRLPEALYGKDFRVIAPDGGYRDILNGAYIGRHESFDVVGVHEGYQVLVRIYATLATIAIVKPKAHIEHATAELLDADGHETEQFFSVFLVIDLKATHTGATAGTLRLIRPAKVHSAG